MLAVEVAVVGGEDHERVVEHALRAQLVEHAATGRVDFGREAVVVLHVLLVALGCVEAPGPTVAAFVAGVREKRGQRAESRVVRARRHGHSHIAVQRHALGLREVLLLVAILGVRGEKRDGQAERLVDGTRAQEVDRVALVLLRHMDACAVGLRDPWLLNPMRAVGKGGRRRVVFRRGKLAVVPLADVADPVAVGAQLRGESLTPRRCKHVERAIAVTRHPLASEHGRSTHAADRSGDGVVREAHAVARELVEARRLHHRIACAAERIVAPVVGVEKDDTEGFRRAGIARRTGCRGQHRRQRRSKHDDDTRSPGDRVHSTRVTTTTCAALRAAPGWRSRLRSWTRAAARYR